MKDVPKATDPAQSSRELRKLVKSKVLKFTDMSECPEKFFLAHRLLSTVGLGGYGVCICVYMCIYVCICVYICVYMCAYVYISS